MMLEAGPLSLILVLYDLLLTLLSFLKTSKRSLESNTEKFRFITTQ